MDGIFISYRREDSAGYAGRLYDRLSAHFGTDRVFMDVEGIEPGTDFVRAIKGAVASCKVLIILIGNRWLSATDASGRRRLDDPHDFVRLETSTALERDIRVVPVLIDNAAMPPQEDLPEDLQLLVRRQALELNHRQWEASSGELIKTLEKILNVPGEPATGRAGPDRPRGKSSGGGPGRMLWIAVVALIAVAAGAAFRYWAPGGDGRVTPAHAPTAGNNEAAAPGAPVIAAQHPAPPETGMPVPGQPPEFTAPVTATAQPPEVAAPAPAPAQPPDVSAPIPAPAQLPEVAAPVTAPAHPPEVAAPVPALVKPAEPAAPPELAKKPEPARPPVISSLTAESNQTGVSVCYQVERARKLRLTPAPGELENPVKDCIGVAPEKPASFTLSATGPGGSSSRQITVSPHPGTLAEMKKRARLPAKGERWVYRTRGKWPSSPQWVVQFSVERADNGRVAETMTLLEPTTKAPVSRSSAGGNPGFVSWPDIGLEFSPWTGAALDLSGSENWEGFATPDIGGWDKWHSNASTSGRERVEVRAGSFDAWKVEAWASRDATGGSTMAGLEPVRVHFQVWYAPRAKRYVKSIRKMIAADGQVLEEDHFELASLKMN